MSQSFYINLTYTQKPQKNFDALILSECLAKIGLKVFMEGSQSIDCDNHQQQTLKARLVASHDNQDAIKHELTAVIRLFQNHDVLKATFPQGFVRKKGQYQLLWDNTYD